ncbi:MAG: protoporphyrinogen oxidase [Candidatus Latescibacteria bacterium]|nr:protoporphyrinogen oxidase [Candidatus Latescibacterota bacterium]
MSERSGNVRRAVVIGGGVSGLATALRLLDGATQRGLDLRVDVLEAAPDFGGNLRTLAHDGWRLEWGPNGFLDNEPATLRLVERLGLSGELVRSSDAARRRFLVVGGRLREIPASPPAFLRTDLFTPRAKLRVLGELLVPRRRDLGRAAEDPATDESVWEFGRRRLGRDFAELMLDPMVKGIFGGDARRLSLAAAFPRMVELERDHGSLFRALAAISRKRRKAADAGPSGTLHSFREGMAALPAALARSLGADPRATLVTSRGVASLRRDGDGWRVGADDGGSIACDAVVHAAPAHAAAAHLRGLDPALAGQLDGIPYVPMAVIALGYARDDVAHDLDGFGMLIPTCEHSRLLGALWTSSIFPGRAPQGRVLLHCMAGGPLDPRVLDDGDGALRDRAVAELRGLLGLRGEPVMVQVFRHARAIAQYEPGHLALLRRIDARLADLPGLHLSGSSYRGVSVNACLKESESMAAAVLDRLAASGPRTEGGAA